MVDVHSLALWQDLSPSVSGHTREVLAIIRKLVVRIIHACLHFSLSVQHRDAIMENWNLGEEGERAEVGDRPEMSENVMLEAVS